MNNDNIITKSNKGVQTLHTLGLAEHDKVYEGPLRLTLYSLGQYSEIVKIMLDKIYILWYNSFYRAQQHFVAL